jgi:hypothetical protein
MAFDRNSDDASEIDRKRGACGKLAMLWAASLVSIAISATEVRAASSYMVAPGHARVHRGMAAPLYNQAPYMPPPVFNPSTPYTAPATPEVPVSPASPGSVFGNGR